MPFSPFFVLLCKNQACMNSFFRQALPPVVKNLIIINLLCWAATLALNKMGFDLVEWAGLHYYPSHKFNLAQLVSYFFLHDPNSFSHVFFNMFSLWMFGKDLENTWGSRKFLLYYTLCGIGAGLVQEITWTLSLPAEINNISALVDMPVTVGASGCVFGLLIAFAMVFPNASIFLLFIPIPIRAPYFVAFYALAELYLGVQSYGGDNIAHFAHLGGMLFGLVLLLYWKKRGILDNEE